MIKKTFRYALIGLLIGSLTFLVFLVLSGDALVTPKEIISVWLMSIGIGLVSAIFEIEWNMLVEVIIHFMVTIGLVMLMCAYNGWLPSLLNHWLISLAIFVLIYAAIWLGMYLSQLTEMRRLNQQIRRRNKK